jgi:hypothetical protein
MKICCCLILFLLPFVSTSQNNFEGTIFYKGYNSFDKDTIYAEGVFGKTMMKFASWKIVNGQKEMYGTYEMYNMVHGLHYSISNRTKTYTVDSIKNTSDEEQLERLDTGVVEIAGHQKGFSYPR